MSYGGDASKAELLKPRHMYPEDFIDFYNTIG